MKPDYYIHQHTREVVETTRDTDGACTHQRTDRTEGEHVMTYRVFQTLKEKDVIGLIGPLAGKPKAKKPGTKGKTKKQRKAQKGKAGTYAKALRMTNEELKRELLEEAEED